MTPWRAIKHLVEHEWRTHPSMRHLSRPDANIFDHQFCAYPGCCTERVLLWSDLIGDFVWKVVHPGNGT